MIQRLNLSTHIVAMLGVVAVTIWIIVRFGERPQHPVKRALLAIIFFLVTAAPLTQLLRIGIIDGSWSPFFSVSRLNGPGVIPFHQIIIPIACLSALFFMLEKSHKLFTLYVVGLSITVLLSRQFIKITRLSDSYTSSPEVMHTISIGRCHGFQRNQFKYTDVLLFEQAMADEAGDKRSYPAGWVDELPFPQKLPKSSTKCMAEQLKKYPLVQASSQWYTPFTGIYKIEYLPTGIWYPGGPLKTGIQRAELRPRL